MAAAGPTMAMGPRPLRRDGHAVGPLTDPGHTERYRIGRYPAPLSGSDRHLGTQHPDILNPPGSIHNRGCRVLLLRALLSDRYVLAGLTMIAMGSGLIVAALMTWGA